MSWPTVVREQVRQRAGFTCEFCSVCETDVGGFLTIDHFQPRSKGGLDTIENLVYACINCNQYKQDYWPQTADESKLWNPREETFSQHLIEIDNGLLAALTTIGDFTLHRLRLNRAQLVSYRLRRKEQLESVQLLARLQESLLVLVELNRQLSGLNQEQQELLQVQRRLIKALLDRR